MNKFRLLAGSAMLAVTLTAGLSAPATAQVVDGIDFGDDSSRWALDGECDDPRFEGAGVHSILLEEDRMRDASDCRALFEAGEIRLIGGAPGSSAPPAGEIDFGDDSSRWANDGECDDPRFEGAGVHSILLEEDRMRDASDCRALYEAGEIRLIGGAQTPPPVPTAPPPRNGDVAPAAGEVDFGDDSSPWANDGECDDPRFVGTGMASELVDADLRRDATDCRTLFEAGSIRLVDDGTVSAADDIDFGDDTSQWANDGECDDPRFAGAGMAGAPVEANRMRDASDCRALFAAGEITLKAEISVDDVDFGDDSGHWPNEGECDDPRFTGPGVYIHAPEDNIGRDASDCRAAFLAGTAVLVENAGIAQFDYGNDNSRWANDGECDDPRFFGAGTNKKLLAEDLRADATDCRMLVESGEAEILPVYVPGYTNGAPFDIQGIEFGNNTSDYANDGECDDPRFVGPGTAYAPFETNEFRDANDCRAAFERGSIMLRP